MKTVKVEKGRFVIDGEETFLYGGELHYFRVPRAEWEQRLDLLKEAGCNLVGTYVPWLWHEKEEGRVDLTGDTREERDLRAFLELVEKKGLYAFLRPGPYVMAELREQGIPEWLLDRYPEIIARTADGKEHPTRVVAYQHPVFLEKVRRWYREVNRIVAPFQWTEGGPVILYQLCNEVGMLHWVSNTSDFNSATLSRFEAYLEETFGSVDALNERFGVAASSFSNGIETFQKGDPSLSIEWKRFWRIYIRDYLEELRRFAEADGIRVPFVVNVHGFKDYSIYSRGTDYPIGLSQLYGAARMDRTVLAGDFYPGRIGYDNYHDLVLASAFTRAVSDQEQPLFSAEFQSGRLADRPRLVPQDLDLNTRTCVAHGMNALNYYMFIAGENYEDIGLFGRRHEWQAPVDSKGRPREHYATARHLGRVFRALGKRLLSAEKVVDTHVGFLPDDYMTEVINEGERARLGELAAKREHFAFEGILRLLVAANISFDAVDLLRPVSPDEVPSLWVFSTEYMDPALQERLVQYVQDGGKLVLYPEIPTKDLKGNPCRVLADQLDLGEWERVSGNDTVDVPGMDSVAVKQRLRFTRHDGEELAVHTRHGKRETAAYHKKAGAGEVLVLGIAIGQDFQYQLDVIRILAERIGIRSRLKAEDPYLSLVERRKESESFLFVHNYDEVEHGSVLYEGEKALFDGEKIVLPPRSGAMFLRNIPVAPGLSIQYSTAEITRLEAVPDKVELSLCPVGPKGVLKLKMEADWKTDGDARPTPDGLRLEIREPLTITLSLDGAVQRT
ncbi:beta-galactosidase [Melghirimyces profundicolus]|uniref:Beta-galactosidase n=1 Tax=Melghirimyces profundicolus TaxID=1242148 RepID=A0A2T6C9H3_9BACL|nr:beta-galactosidase [Melghirimyces profundicolus]PTX64962.1 beta-galactosidase [Melghirimyces profundicolus]